MAGGCSWRCSTNRSRGLGDRLCGLVKRFVCWIYEKKESEDGWTVKSRKEQTEGWLDEKSNKKNEGHSLMVPKKKDGWMKRLVL